MVYLESFRLPSRDDEEQLLNYEERTYIQNQYPFNIFPKKELEKITFDNITIMYGENGSGKSTLLNIIAETLKAKRNINAPKGEMFNRYIEICKRDMANVDYLEIKVISSDDVFDYLFNIRRLNHGGYNRREELVREYYSVKNSKITDFNDYVSLVNTADAKTKSLSQYIKGRMLSREIQEQSNGESALMYFISEIKENSIYILDEPENSMSVSMQLKLAKFIEESARFFNCQFIIATHSPILLSIKDAKIYDLDSEPAKEKAWNELENVKVYYNFFKDHQDEFND